MQLTYSVDPEKDKFPDSMKDSQWIQIHQGSDQSAELLRKAFAAEFVWLGTCTLMLAMVPPKQRRNCLLWFRPDSMWLKWRRSFLWPKCKVVPKSIGSLVVLTRQKHSITVWSHRKLFGKEWEAVQKRHLVFGCYWVRKSRSSLVHPSTRGKETISNLSFCFHPSCPF